MDRDTQKKRESETDSPNTVILHMNVHTHTHTHTHSHTHTPTHTHGNETETQRPVFIMTASCIALRESQDQGGGGGGKVGFFINSIYRYEDSSLRDPVDVSSGLWWPPMRHSKTTSAVMWHVRQPLFSPHSPLSPLSPPSVLLGLLDQCVNYTQLCFSSFSRGKTMCVCVCVCVCGACMHACVDVEIFHVCFSHMTVS